MSNYWFETSALFFSVLNILFSIGVGKSDLRVTALPLRRKIKHVTIFPAKGLLDNLVQRVKNIPYLHLPLYFGVIYILELYFELEGHMWRLRSR